MAAKWTPAVAGGPAQQDDQELPRLIEPEPTAAAQHRLSMFAPERLHGEEQMPAASAPQERIRRLVFLMDVAVSFTAKHRHPMRLGHHEI